MLAFPGMAISEMFTIETPAGSFQIALNHAGPSGSLVQPANPQTPAFSPPSIFSAPLPSGSGARALGLAGAFTALADDATAASWNPAGLIQLERPEASVMLRLSREHNDFSSGSDSYIAGENSFGNENLNYLSAAYPFRWGHRNFVFSLNYQETYDFTQAFSADVNEERPPSAHESRAEGVYSSTQVDGIHDEYVDITITSYLTTRKSSALRQILSSDLLSSLDFEQQGIIDAATPALAAEITPKLAIGAAVNFYQDSPFSGREICSTTRATYQGASSSRVTASDEQVTSGIYEYDGVIHYPFVGDIPFSGEGEYTPFSDSSRSQGRTDLYVEGVYEEKNRFDHLQGINATFGFLWTVSSFLSLGGSVDSPWSADASQTKTIRNTSTTYDASRQRVLDATTSETTVTKDVQFGFPLYWALGAVFRFNNRLYATLDVSQTAWSDFSYEAEDEDKINPIDGKLSDDTDVRDTWAVRSGLEYLLVFSKTEIPLRAGIGWEERPAAVAPDIFWNYSLGTGFSLGKEPGRVLVDFAYVLTQGEDVLGSLVPGENLKADVTEHQFFMSVIKHF